MKLIICSIFIWFLQIFPYPHCCILFVIGNIKKDPTKHTNWHLINNKNCGIAYTNRIMGGKDAVMGQFPWIARVRLNIKEINLKYFYCGGVVLNSWYILTAAHCVPSAEWGRTLDIVRLGEHNVDTNPDCENSICAPETQDIEIAEVISHEGYNKPAPFKNDICLLRLKNQIQFNDFVSPICMVQGALLNYNHTGQLMETAGWGYINDETDVYPLVLQTVNVPVWSNKACAKKYIRFTAIGEDQICAGGVIGKDSCSGDSGGPLMKVFDLDNGPRYFLVGIVSFGTTTCGVSKFPGVYTRMSYFLQWVLEHIRP